MSILNKAIKNNPSLMKSQQVIFIDFNKSEEPRIAKTLLKKNKLGELLN